MPHDPLPSPIEEAHISYEVDVETMIWRTDRRRLGFPSCLFVRYTVTGADPSVGIEGTSVETERAELACTFDNFEFRRIANSGGIIQADDQEVVLRPGTFVPENNELFEMPSGSGHMFKVISRDNDTVTGFCTIHARPMKTVVSGDTDA